MLLVDSRTLVQSKIPKPRIVPCSAARRRWSFSDSADAAGRYLAPAPCVESAKLEAYGTNRPGARNTGELKLWSSEGPHIAPNAGNGIDLHAPMRADMCPEIHCASLPKMQK